MSILETLAASVGDALGKRVPSSYARALSEHYRATVGCVDCGATSPVAGLHFDHVDPSTKYRTASGRAVHPADMVKASGDGMTRYSLRTILAEWSKCEVRCAYCHAARTFPSIPVMHDHSDCEWCEAGVPVREGITLV